MKRKIIIIFLICIFIGLPVPSGESAEKNIASTEIINKLIAGKLEKRNPSFYISLKAILRMIKEKQLPVLVDVRDAQDFNNFRIPGSINIPVFALKTKTFLKTKPIVLINKGYNYSRLEQECRRLRDAGFKRVSILNGGLEYWRQKKAPLEGDIFAIKKLSRISPMDFFEERNSGNLIVVDVSETINPEAICLVPRAIPVPFRDQAEKFIEKIKKALTPYENDPLMSALVYNHNGRYPEKMENIISKAGIEKVFYLQGGLEGYRRFLYHQALILNTKNRAKIVKKCATCP